MTDKKEKRGLGRGLSALMADIDPPKQDSLLQSDGQTSIPVDKVVANPDQPAVNPLMVAGLFVS